jgi:hypothetical protein
MTVSPLSKSIAFVVLLAASCTQDPVSVYGSPDDTVRVHVNQELEITLQNVGPGEYLSPPAIASVSGQTVLRFLDVTLACPCPPAGLTQRFRFEGRQPGVATVAFQHSVSDRVVTAIVKVN